MRWLLSSLLTLVCFAALLPAAPLMVVGPPGADQFALPGGVVLWTVDVTNDFGYLVPTSFNYETLSPVGTFTDLFTTLGLISIGPGQSVPGIGQYDIDPPATPGFVSAGQLVLTFDVFSRDPVTDLLFDPEADYLSSGSLSAPVSVTILSDTGVPEPSTLVSLGLGALVLMLMKRRIA